MIHDWLVSGDFIHPYDFARRNYAQYPAFSIPYHPPVYPGMLGLFFTVTGVSYLSARVFSALCLGVAGWSFYAILRLFGTSSAAALACSCLMVTTPEVVHWARDTMSEIPGLMFILVASFYFLLWMRTMRPAHCWIAFGLAELAFLSRVTTAGILPAWFLYAVAIRQVRRLLSPHLILASLLYLGANIAYTRFAVQFSNIGPALANSRSLVLSWENVWFYPSRLPSLAGWGLIAAAAAGTCCAIRLGRRRNPGLFFLAWIACYYVFQVKIAITEQRYFLPAMCAPAGLAACLFDPYVTAIVRRWLAPGLIAVALVSNIALVAQLPRGLVGSQAVAQRLAELDRHGNVLVAYPGYEGDLMFRYRALRPGSQRSFLRVDRTLAIRQPYYERVPTKFLAASADDVLKIIRRGRVRYLVSCSPKGPVRAVIPEEMVLAHETALSMPHEFALVGTYPLLFDSDIKGRFEAFVWEYRGELPDGPSEIPIVLPKMKMEIQAVH